MINSLNQSNVNMALRCGEQFRRRYILGHRIPPGVALGRGRGLHHASDVNLKQKIVTGVDLPEGDLTDAARDAFVETFNEGIFLTKDQVSEKAGILNKGLNETVALTRLYRQEVAPTIDPLDSELYLKTDIGLDIPLAGILDYLQKEPKVGDLKGVGRSWSNGSAEKEMQPYVYCFLYEREFGRYPLFYYNVLVCTPKGETKHQVFEVKANRAKIDAMLSTVHKVYRMITAGVFIPASPTAWWCDEKWCGYYLTCPYVGNGKQTTWI